MRILIVEDDQLTRHHLKIQFQKLSFQVDTASNAQEANYCCQEFPVDIAIVDLVLPDQDGLSLVRHWRSQERKLPILILSATVNWREKVALLDAGADDYVTKPFEFNEVVSRVCALMRRSNGLAMPMIAIGPYRLDLSARLLHCNCQPVQLTAFEYLILECLMRHAGKVVTKQYLMYQLYSDAELRESHTIDVLMGRLRRKLKLPKQIEVISTVRGQGYRFEQLATLTLDKNCQPHAALSVVANCSV